MPSKRKKSHQKKSYLAKLGLPRLIINILSIAGLLIMLYLTYLHFANARSFCDLSESVSCDVVTTSIYSEVFGLPVSLLGLFYFGFVLYLALDLRRKDVFKIIFFVTLFSLIPSYYLSLTEIFFIKALCILCELSKILMLLILGITFIAVKKEKMKELGKKATFIIFTGLVAAAVTYFAQTGNVTKKDFSEFVTALNTRGVVYYKSIKCSNCRRQERLFGKAYQKLNSIECHPEGINPQPEYCLEKRINKTPTFILEKEGVEIKRLEGLQSLENIAKWADVPFKK